MEHQKEAAGSKPISKILKFLPKATSSVSFQNPSINYSPVKDKKPSEKSHKSNLGIGFSGPMVSIVPSDSRRKTKNNDSAYELVYEPTSPRVSCMGQVKCKHYRKLAAAAAAAAVAANATNKPVNKLSRATTVTSVRTDKNEDDQEKITKLDPVVTKSKKTSGIRSLFRGGAGSSRRKSDATDNKSKTPENLSKAPSLGKMKRFSSGRDAFSNFDWRTQVTPLDSAHRSSCSDDEEVKIPSSAPVMERNKGISDNFVRVGGVNLEPRKEINLWKRRTMVQPKPLQLNVAN
ncbi:hypothetical protein R6Q59_029942 [Mikania micrantha]|uniref:Uncharacterized protein n=1 Tax=Mikania micrantha TaxID=192012 RepID=A0A5N6LSZ7_9ASTR|nr:hypothetical protein E3N88_37977 [Mikania micrantha]